MLLQLSSIQLEPGKGDHDAEKIQIYTKEFEVGRKMIQAHQLHSARNTLHHPRKADYCKSYASNIPHNHRGPQGLQQLPTNSIVTLTLMLCIRPRVGTPCHCGTIKPPQLHTFTTSSQNACPILQQNTPPQLRDCF